MVRRIYVEKKPGLRQEAQSLLRELRTVRFKTARQFPDTLFLNINTPASYDALPEKGAPHD